MKYICYLGHILSAIILTKLIFLGKKLNFLNICFITIFFYETVGGLFLIPSFFSVGQQNWFGDPKPEELVEECARWFTSYCVLGSFLAFTNTGMIFTRFGNMGLIGVHVGKRPDILLFSPLDFMS